MAGSTSFACGRSTRSGRARRPSTRPPISPGKSRRSSTGKFPILRTGDLTPQRDLTDVRDMVQAYIRLMEVGKKGDVYNAGSGTTCVMHDLLMKLLAMSTVQVTVEETPDASRFGDTSVSRADTTKLRTTTGWQPSYSLDQSLHDILADWRSRTSKTSP